MASPPHIDKNQPFEHWMQLPIELRCFIWNLTLPTRQIHVLQFKKYHETGNDTKVCAEIYIPLPVALQVCSESREALRRRLTAITRTSRLGDARKVYCDFSSDSLFLDDLSLLALLLDKVPAGWHRFTQLCVSPLDGDPRQRQETEARLTREAECLSKIFTSSERVLLAKFLGPHNKAIPRTFSRIPKCPRNLHRLALTWVGETAKQFFPAHLADTEDVGNRLSMIEERQLWVNCLTERAEGPPIQVHFAVVNVSCEVACLIDAHR
ncbi:hypothetical protein LY76DRAFT_596497 [Colletotrichum caudatum]|nr:hypothetical protein LY76DRAFT_596497 [Colletotrichum caudatum]